MRLVEAVVTGVTQGAMIALVSLGYTMVYGVLRLINFAHSEVFMMAAYVGLILVALLVGDPHSLGGMLVVPESARAFAARGVLAAHPVVGVVLATIGAMMLSAALGLLIERAAYRPLRGRGGGGSAALRRITPLVTALGVSVLLQNVAQLLFGTRLRPYPQLLDGTVRVSSSIALSTSRVAILATALVVMIGLELLVKRTWFGMAMRAVSTNEEAARLMGVQPSRVVARTFALGSALAALGAILFCLDQSQVYPTMGVTIGTRAFVAAVLGGIGSIGGAMLGGLVVGVVGELVKLTDWSGGVDVLVFGILIAVLLVRPTGLVGAERVEKV